MFDCAIFQIKMKHKISPHFKLWYIRPHKWWWFVKNYFRSDFSFCFLHFSCMCNALFSVCWLICCSLKTFLGSLTGVIHFTEIIIQNNDRTQMTRTMLKLANRNWWTENVWVSAMIQRPKKSTKQNSSISCN